jgi:hypothetical protein
VPAITYSDFSGGLDRRLPIDVQDANRLWSLRNAYVTLGKRIKKRPGLILATTGLSGSVGLENINGTLTVFVSTGSTFAAPTGVTAQTLELPSGYAADSLLGVTYGDTFSGFAYVVALYHTVTTRTKSTFDGVGSVVTIEGRIYRHHYLDTVGATLITDANCPTTGSVCKAASRIFAINGETVRYSKAGNPRDWTEPSDAGFLPVALQQDVKADCTAVGSFADKLVVAFPEGAQIWKVAVDPTANELTRRIEGVGSEQPTSFASFASDLMFLSPYGFRSMTVQAQVDRIDDTDVGVPVDALVVPDVQALPDNSLVIGLWLHELGQYWAIFDDGDVSKAWVYTYSRSSKIACWSEYTFLVKLTGACTQAGKVFLRSATDLYQLDVDTHIDEIQYDEAGVIQTGTIPVEVQMAFQDAKTPGVDKQWYGADFVFAGTADVSYLYDPRDQTKESTSQAVSGNTAPGQTVGVEIVSASIAPVIRHEADEAFEFTRATLYFSALVVT